MLISIIGGLLGYILAVPLGEMLGAMIAVIIVSRFKPDLIMPQKLLIGIQLILGINIGNLIQTDNLFSGLSTSVFLGLFICMLLQISVGFIWLYHREGWNKLDSFLGAVPGALTTILAITSSASKPSQRIIFIHSIRLVFLMIIAGMIGMLNQSNINSNPQLLNDILFTNYWNLLFLLINCFVFGLIFGKLGIPAPFMITSIIISALANFQFPQFSFYIPKIFTLISMALLGGLIGTHMKGVTQQETRTGIKSGLIVTSLSLCITFIIAGLFSYLLNIPFSVLLLSWVPGSLEAMSAVAILLNLEPAFVAFNHMIRLTILNLVPFLFAKLLTDKKLN